MLERIKLNKVSLRSQKQKLALYQRFLPALEARKQQFLMQLARVRKEIAAQETRVQELLKEIGVWSSLYGDLGPLLRPFIEIEEVKSAIHNVAGLKVPRLLGVVFKDPPYSFFATPFSFEMALGKTREVIEAREAIRMLREQEAVLFEGFRKTSQRINLYEQRLIPGCREAIRKIAVYLQDQQAAGVGVAKVAKRMAEETMQASGG